MSNPSDLDIDRAPLACGVGVHDHQPAATIHTPPDDAFVMLDPAVETLDAEMGDHRVLCHGHFDVAMVVPPGEGLLAFVSALEHPVRVRALREEFDDQQLIDAILASLSLHGFIHVTSQETPSTEGLAELRRATAETRRQMLRRAIDIDLDAPMSLDWLRAELNVGGPPPNLLLRCARLADQSSTLSELAGQRQGGTLRVHRTVIHTGDLRCEPALRRSLTRLGASVTLDSVPWPAPDAAIAGMAELTAECVAVHVLIVPDLSILDETIRDRAIAWATSAFVSGLRLKLDAEALWPAGPAGEEAFVDLFDAVQALEDRLGDVVIVGLPSDDVLLGMTVSDSSPDHVSALANRFRRAYLCRRIMLLKSHEADNTWSQVPEVEDKLVRAEEDLLPNHPQLLRLRPGSVVVDVCGGLGRVARRLAPAVGQDGRVISIELVRCLSERGRQVACQRQLTNLDFRVGLAQRLPFPDGAVDAAVNEWTGAIWELGLGPAMVKEMARVVRPGGRVAVTHRLVQLPLAALAASWVQYPDIYAWLRAACDIPELTIVAERVWGQIVPSLVGERATHWRKQYLPRLVDPFDWTYDADEVPGTRADVYLTIVAQRQ